MLKKRYTNIRNAARRIAMMASAIMLTFSIQAQDSSERTFARDSTGESVGLVLSGGGAKGIAHIGVIQALEDNEIPIDYVAGTSMGAIVGGLYAAGYTPEEMIDMILSKDFASWSSGTIDQNLTYYFVKRPATPAFAHVNINLGKKDSLDRASSLMPSSLISPIPMNFAFMDLFAAYTAQCGGDFNKLFVPFRCVTSDVVHKHKIVCRDGMLSDAIRASMTFPAVFEPIKMNGVDVYDGGIYDNFPVDVMREDFAPAIMIGVDVHAIDEPPSNGIVSQLENMIIQNNNYDLPAEEGIKIHVDVSQFSLLDWGKAKEIYTIGYNRAMEFMDSIKGRVASRVPKVTRNLRRAVFKSKTPYVRFDSVHVTGATPEQNRYIESLFKSSKTDTFGIREARLAYYRAITPGKLRNLFPQAHYQPETGLFTLDMEASVRDNFSLGAGGYLSSTTNSMIFLSANYASMTFRSAEAHLMGWLGQSYMAGQFEGRMYLSTHRPSAFDLVAVYSRQKFYESDKLFYQDNSPAFISQYEGFVRLQYGWAVTRAGKAFFGIGGGQLKDRFYATDHGDFSKSGNEETRQNLAQAIGCFEVNNLNNRNFASEGKLFRFTAMQVLGRYHYKGNGLNNQPEEKNKSANWFQAEAAGEFYIPLNDNFTLGATGDLLVSNRKLLNTYYASLVNAPDFAPTPATTTVFNKAFRANSFVALGVVPIWQPLSGAQVRLSANAFMPFRQIQQEGETNKARYGKWFRNPEFICELDLVYNLPFASICGYVNYLSYPSGNWNFGLSFGLFFKANRFLR